MHVFFAFPVVLCCECEVCTRAAPCVAFARVSASYGSTLVQTSPHSITILACSFVAALILNEWVDVVFGNARLINDNYRSAEHIG